jgi:hypothetical protein
MFENHPVSRNRVIDETGKGMYTSSMSPKMIHQIIAVALVSVTTLTTAQAAPNGETSWRIDTADEWNGAARQIEGLAVEDDLLSPTGKQGLYRSNLQRFEEKRSAQAITLTASTRWDNGKATAKR